MKASKTQFVKVIQRLMGLPAAPKVTEGITPEQEANVNAYWSAVIDRIDWILDIQKGKNDPSWLPEFTPAY